MRRAGADAPQALSLRRDPQVSPPVVQELNAESMARRLLDARQLVPRHPIAFGEVGHPDPAGGVFAETLPEVARNPDDVDRFEVVAAGIFSEHGRLRSHPQLPFAILVRAEHRPLGQAVGGPDRTPAVAAELKEALERGGPDRPGPILCERQHVTSGEPFGLAIQREGAVADPSDRGRTADADADPDASIAGDQQGRRRAGRQPAAGGSAPLVEPGAVEADQAGVSGQPQVAVAVLPDRADASGRHPIAFAPRGDRVVAERLVQRGGNGVRGAGVSGV